MAASQYKLKDEQLFAEVQKMIDGNFESYESVYELSKNYIYKIINDIVQNHHTTEDMMQETYLQIYNKIGTLREARTFYVWAGRIASNLTLRHLQKYRKEVLQAATEDDEGEFIFDNVVNDDEAFIPETVLENEEQQRIIAGIMEGLSPEQKLTVQYYYFEEMSVGDIANLMECSTGTIKSRLNYARKSLKTAVSEFEVKHDVKLYSLASLPVFFMVFHKVASGLLATSVAATVAGGAVAGNASVGGGSVSGASVSAGGTATGSAVTTGTGTIAGSTVTTFTGATTTTATAVASGISAKAIAMIAAGVIAVSGGVIGGIHLVEGIRSEVDAETDEEDESKEEDFREDMQDSVATDGTAQDSVEEDEAVNDDKEPGVEAVEFVADVYVVPIGGTYYVGATGEVLEEGTTIPEAGENDELRYGDYIYKYINRGENNEYLWAVEIKDGLRSATSLGPIVETIGGEAIKSLTGTFFGYTNLIEAPKLPEGTVYLASAFWDCSSLVNAPDIPEGVEDLGHIFEGCSSLQEAPKIPTTAKDMMFAFAECCSLKKMPEIPYGVTNMAYAFSNCSSLVEVTEIPESVVYLVDTFFKCTSLVEAPEIPEGVENIGGIFYGCSSLIKAPVIPSSVINMSLAFGQCTSLTGTIVINANGSEFYCEQCFQDIDFDAQGLTLEGDSPYINMIRENEVH